jgi:hypothetical protein
MLKFGTYFTSTWKECTFYHHYVYAVLKSVGQVSLSVFFFRSVMSLLTILSVIKGIVSKYVIVTLSTSPSSSANLCFIYIFSHMKITYKLIKNGFFLID